MTFPVSRRSLLKAAGFSLAAAATASYLATPNARAAGQVLGQVIDYSAGVPRASAIKAAGYLGAIRYVSQPRPDAASWMLGKPVTLTETTAFADAGLHVASVYQYGKAGSADWLAGAAGAVTHAPKAIALHAAAGGPKGVPIYVAIDDDPTRAQYDSQIRPYLQGFATALAAAGYQLGIYGNYHTISWALADGLGKYFWQHNWGSDGLIHPRANVHQIQIDASKVDGIGVDINNVYTADWGQWVPTGVAASVGEAAQEVTELAQTPGGSNPTITLPGGITLDSQQISDLIDGARRLSS